MKKLKLILIVSILIYVISIIVIYFEAKKKREQKNTKKSLQEGFGSYGDEESLGCFSPDGKCSSKGTETSVQYCRPHPNTGRGCIDENGNQTYTTIIKRKPCQTQCTASKFTVEDGVRVSNPETSYLGTSVSAKITSVGCDNIVDKRFGINLTSNFLGKFNTSTYKYPLKTCVPDGKDSIFQGYYKHVSTCLQADGKGSNNCRIVCGRDKNILNLNGFANAKLNKKLLSYFPTEENEEGEIRNVCYDINNIDRIEVLNYPGNVPEDFVYPNKCYKHTNVLNFNESIWPTSGTNNIFNLTELQVSEDISYIDLSGDQITQFETYVSKEGNPNNIINHDYDLNNNQDSYVKLRIGSNSALLEKIYENTTSGIYRDKNSSLTPTIETNTFYLACELNSPEEVNTLASYFENIYDSGTQPIQDSFYLNNTSTKLFNLGYYFNASKSVYAESYFIREGNLLYFPCSILEFFIELPLLGGVNDSYIKHIGSTTVIGNVITDGFTEGKTYGIYIVVKNNVTQENRHMFTGGTIDTDKKTFTIGNVLIFSDGNDIQLEKIYISNSHFDVINAYDFSTSQGAVIKFTGGGRSNPFTFEIDMVLSYFTESVFINKFVDKPATYNYLNIHRNISELPGTEEGSSIPYCVFATSPHNNMKGYHYPLYLVEQKKSDLTLSFMDFPGVQFKTPAGTCIGSGRSNFYFRPSHYQDKDLLFFNEEILTASVKYTNSYMNVGDPGAPVYKYFLSGIQSINQGNNYFTNGLYRLYNHRFSQGYDLDQTGLTNIQEINTGVKNGTSLSVAVSYTGTTSPEVKTIKIIRGNSAFVSAGVGVIANNTDNENKVKDYFTMIQYQGFETDSETTLIFEPQRYLTLTADFSVFKSPYTLNGNNQKNFLCYDELGRARPEGYIETVTTNGSKVYTNIACPNKTVKYEVDSDHGAFCAVKGVRKLVDDNTIKICTQERNAKATNFINNEKRCIISEDSSEYKTLNNQLGFGLELVPIEKSLTFSGLSQNAGDTVVNTLNTYPSYFTRELEEDKLYGPKEEFYIEKTRNNYFVSLTNSNVDFVENVASWRRVFIFDNNIVISPFQYLFDIHTPNIIDNKINNNLGKFIETFNSLKTNTGADLNVAFVSNSSGVLSQNYLNQAITYSWGGSRRRTRYGAEFDDSTDTERKARAFYSDYIKQMEDSTYRVNYFDNFFAKPTAGTRGMSVNPNYVSLKFSGNVSATPSFKDSTPIYATFGIEQDVNGKDIMFSSKFYDENLGIPWASNVEVGDIFNPDFTYFNFFIYTFLLWNGSNQVVPGNTPNPLLKDKFLENAVNQNVRTTFSPIINGQVATNLNPTPGGYNTPEVSDYILQIPTTFYNSSTVTNNKDTFTLDSNFPQYYPTLRINRIKSIENKGDNNTITFDDNDYSETSGFNSSTGPVYLFNLGKSIGNDNLVTRCFDIKGILETQQPVDVGNIYYPPENVKFITSVVIANSDYSNPNKVIPCGGKTAITGVWTYFKVSFQAWIPEKNVPITYVYTTVPPDKKGGGQVGKDYIALSGVTNPCNGPLPYWTIPINQYAYVTDSSPQVFGLTSKGELLNGGKLPAGSKCDNGVKNPFLTQANIIGLTTQTGTAGGCAVKNKYNAGSYIEMLEPEKAYDQGYKWDGADVTATVIRKAIEFNFKIDSISQEEMQTLFDQYKAAQNTAYTPPGVTPAPYPYKAYGGATLTCADNKIYSEAEWIVAYKDGYTGDSDPKTSVPCFNAGCMTGYPEKGSKKVANFTYSAACANFLGDPGHTATGIGGCPAGKYWRCIQTQESFNKIAEAEARAKDLNNGGNFLTPILSSRYVKKMSQSPYKKITGNQTYATLYNSSPEDFLNIKVMSQVTEIAYNLEMDNKFHINEFREDINYFVKQVDKVFSEGDTFDYYFSKSSINDIFSGRKNSIKIATFRVEEVGVRVKNPEQTLQAPYQLYLDFDYKCSMVSSVGNISELGLYNKYFGNFSKATNYNRLYAFLERTVEPAFWRYTLPYTLVNQGSSERCVIDGHTDDVPADFTVPGGILGGPYFSFNRSPSLGDFEKASGITFSGNSKFASLTLINTDQKNAGIPAAGFYLDTYKIINGFTHGGLSDSIDSDNPFNSPGYTGAGIRSGSLDTLVLTGTRVESDLGQKAYVNITKVSGKPYGVGFIPSAPQSSITMINYKAFGKIEEFSFNKSSTSFPLNTVLKSNKGFKIKFLAAPPPILTFQNIKSPSGKILPYENNFDYTEGDIVNIKDRNLRQYFRNMSGVTIPYMKNINISNPIIPFAIYEESTNRWLYPVYKSEVPGSSSMSIKDNKDKETVVFRKDKMFQLKENKGKTRNTSKYLSYTATKTILKKVLSSFKRISETVYPEVNFVDYGGPDTYYDIGNVVKSDGKLYTSLVNLNNAPLTDINSWRIDDLKQTMTSNTGDQFYSLFKQDDNFLDVIDSVKNLNNQNFPALVKYNFDKSGILVDSTGNQTNLKENEYEFCPEPCTYYDLKEDYSNSFLGTCYFDSIRYLFETPTMITQPGSDLFLSLGNAPVSKSKNYNVGFLQDGGARQDFLSQYLYFINIKDQEEKYNRPLCTGGLCVTTSSGLCATDANKFEFANSLLFNFLPCSLDDQDFIKYSIGSSIDNDKTFLVSSLPEYPSSSTPNIFPDLGVSCHVLLSSNNGTCFTPSYGYFEYTYADFDTDTTSEINLIGPKTGSGGGGTSVIKVSGITREPFFNVTGAPTNLSYGDNWYMADGDPRDTPFGFVIPKTSGTEKTKNARSFIQLNRSTNYTNAKNIISFPGEPISSGPDPYQPFTFTISNNNIPNPGTTSGTYVSPGTKSSYHIQFNGPTILQRGKAIFRGDTDVPGAENIYLPTYDIIKNIKAQAVAVFGESFVGNIGYTLDSDNANFDLNGEKRSTMIFSELRNDLLLTDIDKRKKEVFAGDKTINVDNFYKTFMINFNNTNNTFSIKPNLFENPIRNPTNTFLYRGGTSSVDPTYPMSSVNTESTTVIISRLMYGMKGVSVNINLEDFLEYKTAYLKNGTQIPGKTNVQLQLEEIRENRTSTYIQPDNKCSIYFEPIVGVLPQKLVTATWNMTMSTGLNKFGSKESLGSVKRYNASSFTNSATRVNFINKSIPNNINIQLGCNLYYLFDQTDSSNIPVVFSDKEFGNGYSGTCYTSTITIDSTKTFVIQYLINKEPVPYKTYIEKFSRKDTNSRGVEISYRGNFGLSVPDYNNAFIYYGPNNAEGVNSGGKIKFNYH